MSCNCSGSSKMVLACSGASNVGQLSNEAAKRLDIEQSAKFYCLAGPGGDIDAMVSAVNEVEKLVVIDGCGVACAKLIMERSGIDNYCYVVVTDLGIEKNRNFSLPEADIECVTSACRAMIDVKCE
ncbi:MAG: putative zinc-binding protein [Armatimonadetes bacterium]|nr:putative zinc-binding protein [Armatimonadota bacterium]